MKYNTDETLVAETLVTGFIKYNNDESIVTETLVTGLIKYNNDETLVTGHKAFISIVFYQVCY
jgi:hypothetical protein